MERQTSDEKTPVCAWCFVSTFLNLEASLCLFKWPPILLNAVSQMIVYTHDMGDTTVDLASSNLDFICQISDCPKTTILVCSYSCVVSHTAVCLFPSSALSSGAPSSREARPGPVLRTRWSTNGPNWTEFHLRLQGDILREDTR